jgi:hypothetical protein
MRRRLPLILAVFGSAAALAGLVVLSVILKPLPASAPAPAPAVVEPPDVRGDGEWADAAEKRRFAVGDVRVAVTQVSENPEVLRVGVLLDNHSAARRLQFVGWGKQRDPSKDLHAAKLVDNLGNEYQRLHYGVGMTRHGMGRPEILLGPGSKLDMWLDFEAPAEAAAYLRLTLPASAVGEVGEFRFHIPTRIILR